MSNYIIINPSPNLIKLAEALREEGTVSVIYTRDYMNFNPDNIWAFVDGNILSLNEIDKEAEMGVCNLTKPFFSYFSRKQLKMKLASIDSSLQNAEYQDYILINSKLWRNEVKVVLSNKSYDEIVSGNPSSIIITSKIPASNGKYILTHWKTDYDVKEALGNDYFFFFDEAGRNEVFRVGDELVTISEHKSKTSDWLKRVNPSFSRFSFEKTSSMAFHQNKDPWVVKFSSRVFLINDYSVQRVSVVMPDCWVKGLRKHLFVKEKGKK